MSGSDEGALYLELIYKELRALAAHYMRGERQGHTLQPTDLVHEAYLRLARIDRVEWKGKSHFFATAARQMRRVLVDHARRKGAQCREAQLITLSEEIMALPASVDVLVVDSALDRLAARNNRQAQVAELRFFAGMTEIEVAEALGVSERTVRGDWRVARAWLAKALTEGDDGDG